MIADKSPLIVVSINHFCPYNCRKNVLTNSKLNIRYIINQNLKWIETYTEKLFRLPHEAMSRGRLSSSPTQHLKVAIKSNVELS